MCTVTRTVRGERIARLAAVRFARSTGGSHTNCGTRAHLRAGVAAAPIAVLAVVDTARYELARKVGEPASRAAHTGLAGRTLARDPI